MQDVISDLKKQLEEIKVVEVNSDKLKAFNSEDDFNSLGVDFLIETGSYVCIAACMLPADTKVWNRDQAIIGGNLVRLYKLLSALLDQTCQRRREISFIIGRLAFETIVNLAYMIKNSSPELFKSYVSYSLQHEKKLLNLIRENIAARNGEKLAIENRMLKSIERAFLESEIKEEDISTREIKNWGGKNIFERARDVELEDSYLALFGGGSHSIHGNWMDILEYNLDGEQGGFTPQLEWKNPRPQLLHAIAFLSAKTVHQYFHSINEPEVAELIGPLLQGLMERIHTVDTAHEEFLHR